MRGLQVIVRLAREPVEGSEDGKGRGTVVFLHGVGSDATVWDGQLGAVPALDAVAFDMPGYRGSSPSKQDEASSVAATVLDSLPAGSGPLHLVGLSLGAIVAAHAAVLQPRRIATLTLASAFLRYPEGEAVATRAAAAATEGMGPLAVSRVNRILHPDTNGRARDAVVESMSKIPIDAYQRMSRAVWTADLTDVAPRLRCPTLVMTGNDDPVTPPGLGRELAAAIPGSRFVAVPQASHLINLDQAGPFNELLHDHIQVRTLA